MKKLYCFIIIICLLIFTLSKNLNAQWQQTGFADTTVASLSISGSNLFAGTFEGLYLTSNNGVSWISVNNGLGNFAVHSVVVADTNLFAGAILHGVFLSTNNGSSWAAVNNFLAYGVVTCLCVSGLNIFAGTLNLYGIYLSTDFGSNWFAVNNGLSNAGNISALVTLGSNVFAGTDYNGVYLTTNNGTNWIEVNYGLTNQHILSFTVSDTNLFAGTANGVYLTTDYGTNWVAVNNGLENKYVVSLTSFGDYLFAATSDDVIYLSRNSGANWATVGGLANVDIRCLTILDSILFLGTNNEGVWKIPFSDIIVSVEDKNVTPLTYSLSQNYPNPFNPATTITYQIPQAEFVKLKVYDILGREIATLVNEEKSAGNYEIQFIGSEVTSGIYFYKLKVGNFTETKKMILLR